MIYTVTLAGDKDVDKSVEISLILKKLNIDSVVTGISISSNFIIEFPSCAMW